MTKPLKIKKKKWGVEVWIANTDKYCGKLLFLKKGYQCSLHRHIEKDETFLILEGKVLMRYEKNENGKHEEVLKCFDFVRIRPEILHRFTGLRNSVMVEFSTHHSEKDTIRIAKSCRVGVSKKRYKKC